MNAALVRRVAERLESCALIGAYALAARGYVRQTADVDLLTVDRAALEVATWSDLSAEGIDVDVRKGDFSDPLAGVVRIRDATSRIDVVVAKYKWQKAVVDRAQQMDLSGITLPVPRASDLVLLKLFAGGYGDRLDIVRLMEAAGRQELIAEVDAAIADLPDEMQERWANLRPELA